MNLLHTLFDFFFARPRLYIEDEPQSYRRGSVKDKVYQDYNWICERIDNAVTMTELAWLEEIVGEFEEEHRGLSMWTNDFFIDLLTQLQARANVLYSKNLKVG